MLQIGGYQKLTLLDFPGKVACTVFLGGCNFRCPFCHNSELFVPEVLYSEEEILAMIQKRARVLEGVAITGGEPTLQAGLHDFICKLRDMGLQVKRDSNGYRPEVLRQLLDEHLLDYVAMDIKSSPAGYPEVVGMPGIDMGRINESVHMLMSGDVPFEFRTTVVPELHSEEDFEEIGAWIAGPEAYFLQAFVDSELVFERKFSQPTPDLMERIKAIVQPYVPNVEIRGVN